MKNIPKRIWILCSVLCWFAAISIVTSFSIFLNPVMAEKYNYTLFNFEISTIPPAILFVTSLYYFFGQRFSNFAVIFSVLLFFGPLLIKLLILLSSPFVPADPVSSILFSVVRCIVLISATLYVALSKVSKEYLQRNQKSN